MDVATVLHTDYCVLRGVVVLCLILGLVRHGLARHGTSGVVDKDVRGRAGRRQRRLPLPRRAARTERGAAARVRQRQRQGGQQGDRQGPESGEFILVLCCASTFGRVVLLVLLPRSLLFFLGSIEGRLFCSVCSRPRRAAAVSCHGSRFMVLQKYVFV